MSAPSRTTSPSSPVSPFSSANPHALASILEAAETRRIIATRDIFDLSGIKLWARDQPVSAALQRKLLDRQLRNPLETCLMAADGVTTRTLLDTLSSLLAGTSALAEALAPDAPRLLHEVAFVPLHPVVQLLLTAGQAARPESFDHAVQAMALAGALMIRRNAGLADVRLAMLGGLVHDLGELYIDPSCGEADAERTLDLASYQQLVVHPHVGRLLLAQLTNYPAVVARAVDEHHERLDGSGYPARLTGPDCSELGRLLAVVEVTVGILRGGRSPLTRASFALRVVPGEFDPQWASFVCNLARAAEEAVPDDMLAPAGLQNSPLTLIEQRIERARQVLTTLQGQGRSGPILQIVETALARLGRLQVAWNALGFWGAQARELSAAEQFELALANRELQQRLSQLQRECLLLSERLGELEKTWIEPLWRGALPQR